MVTTFLLVSCLIFPDGGMAEKRAVDLELVLAVDISRSMDLDEAALVRQGFVRALRHPDVVAAIERGRLGRIAVTYVEWGSERYQRVRVDWSELSDAASAAAFAEEIERSSVFLVEYTSISDAIAFASRHFKNNGFQGERRVVDISGDGPNNSGPYVNLARDQATAEGIVINGLPIVNDRPNVYSFPPFPDLDLYYEDCVVGGPGAFIVVADGFEDFARAILRKLVTEIADRSPPQGRIWLTATRPRPPCNAGELQLQEFQRNPTWRQPIPLYDF